MGKFVEHSKLKICERCILPETFPGIKFDEDGVCNHCKRAKSINAKASEKKEKYRQRFDKLIKDTINKAPVYDVIMAYSGGKDSTYTMKLLKERYALRILAFTFDNHFVSPLALDNIKKCADILETDHIQFRLPWPAAHKIFSLTAKEDIFSAPTLLRASSVCTACIGFVKSIVLKTALEMSIPFVAFGWSPGQAPIQAAIMKNNPDLIFKAQRAQKKAFPSEIKKIINHYFLPENYFEKFKERFPYNIHPLAFFKYDEKQIIKELYNIGWKEPTDTDTNSSNCLLNALANQRHIERHGFHPYVWEIANMVRQDIISREEGINKIYSKQKESIINFAQERLGL